MREINFRISTTRQRAIIASLLAASLVHCGGESDRLERGGHLASASCPLKTPAAWQGFLEAATADESWVKTCSVQAKCADGMSVFATHVHSDVQGVFEKCARDLIDNPPIARCTARLRRFVPAWLRQHASDSYGFAQDNHAYLAAQSQPDIPPHMMDPPAEIVAALPERAKIEEAARTNGWPYLTHDSCLGAIRTFVTVSDPGDRFEQWLLVGLDADALRVNDSSVMSFIGVQKRTANGQKLAKVRLHFRDYIVSKGSPSWSLDLPEPLSGKCFACHGSGMRGLIPTHGSTLASAPVKGEPGYNEGNAPADFALGRLSSLNQRLLSYGLPDWNGTIDPGDYGPPLGQSLGCTRCHDGTIRGALTVATDEDTLKRKIVDELSMRSPDHGGAVPDQTAIELLDREQSGTPLSTEEKVQLARARTEHSADYNAFLAARFPSWRAWALMERCDQEPIK